MQHLSGALVNDQIIVRVIIIYQHKMTLIHYCCRDLLHMIVFGSLFNLSQCNVNRIQQSMLIASNLSALLLSGSPSFQQLAHGSDDLVVRALALQYEQRMRYLHIAHAQPMCFADAR
jgi:hypothetical protein